MNSQDKMPIYANLAVIDQVIKGAKLDESGGFDERLLSTAKNVELLRNMYFELFAAVAGFDGDDGMSEVWRVLEKHMDQISFMK